MKRTGKDFIKYFKENLVSNPYQSRTAKEWIQDSMDKAIKEEKYEFANMLKRLNKVENER
tara:strand:+ start:251 stop:430 length:180 start_codon:yes stop_codon:yes gene_type:complete